MKLPDGHLRMIEAVACTNPNTVVVLLCGGVVECPWEERVKAILYMGLPGQAGGEAVGRSALWLRQSQRKTGRKLAVQV